ncbi:hypothetical protein A9P82_12175 [Arachidicoccus ginsenosidimutans]|uniref:DUF3823 domain-containing protein n=1 Tax=Arachidicoccus sp. BS20 TaxID=1850526 RepID=UPI0007F0A1A6|nr:DUF3823 domain-containing protein [Arachidicoccus sp. BS20]ANI89975.1 hypothetical protein A9P82_12175 [Arachidicoccus sp. BS20]
MKNIFLIFSVLSFGILSSCMKTDNYAAPDATFSGNVIDSITGKPFLTSQGEAHIRIWEVSYKDNPTPQDIPIKQDGTFNDTKLFSATYDMQPYGGAFWPTQRDSAIKLNKSLQKDFKVVPYLYVVDVNSQLDDSTLHLTCRLKAPITQNLPQVLDIRPFISLTQFVGNNSTISEYQQDKYKINVNSNWGDGVGDMTTGEGFTTYALPALPLRKGRTYYVRVGVRVEDTYQQYNYSDIITIQVP